MKKDVVFNIKIELEKRSLVSHLFVELLKLVSGLGDDLDGLLDFLLGNDKWRSESDGVIVGGFGQKSFSGEDLGEMVSVNGKVIIKLNSNEQSTAANVLEERRVDLSEFRLQQLSHVLRILNHAFFNDGLNSGLSDCHGQGVTSVSTSVVTRSNVVHDEVVSQTTTDGQHAS